MCNAALKIIVSPKHKIKYKVKIHKIAVTECNGEKVTLKAKWFERLSADMKSPQFII
jgi:hypothetical protein